MKYIKQLGCMFLAGLFLCGVLAFAAAQEDTPIPAAIPELPVAPETEQFYTMKIADQVQLKVVAPTDPKQPDDDSDSDIPGQPAGSSPDTPEVPDSKPKPPGETPGDWHSDDETVVTVDTTGLVTAVGEGTTKVYKKVSQGVVSVTITVSGYTVTEIHLKADTTMIVDKSQTIQVSIVPEQAEPTLTWTSDDPEILTVTEDGTVTAVHPGKATVTVQAENGITASIEITVTGDQLSRISIRPASLSLNIGQSQAVQAIPEPAGADIGKLSWKSSDVSVAYYKNGKIYGAGAGNATITATTQDGKSASCKVHVTGGSLSVRPKALTLRIGQAQTIRAYVTPAGTPVTWSSSNSAVARVDQHGGVTALKSGTTVITAKAGRLTASCVVTVIRPSTPNTFRPTTPNTFRPTTPNTFPNLFDATGGILYLPGSLISADTFYTMPANIPSAVYLTIDSDFGTSTDSILSALSASNASATFFVPIQDLYASDDMLRHIAGNGNSIGFLLTAEQASGNVIQLLNTANEQLSVITGTPTQLVRIAGGSSGNITSEQASAIIHAGYRLWDWNLAARETSLSAQGADESIRRGINTANAMTVRFGSNPSTAAVLQKLLPYMKYCGIPIYAISAGDMPVCNIAVE